MYLLFPVPSSFNKILLFVPGASLLYLYHLFSHICYLSKLLLLVDLLTSCVHVIFGHLLCDQLYQTFPRVVWLVWVSISGKVFIRKTIVLTLFKFARLQIVCSPFILQRHGAVCPGWFRIVPTSIILRSFHPL